MQQASEAAELLKILISLNIFNFPTKTKKHDVKKRCGQRKKLNEDFL